MNERTHDAPIINWLTEGPERGSPEAVDRALAATRRVSQRPEWAILERWSPMQLTMRRVNAPKLAPILLIALLVLALAAIVAVVGSRQRLPAPFGPAANGRIAFDAGGRVYLAHADGSDPQPVGGGLGSDRSPSFSPDGTRVAFLSTPGFGHPSSLFVAHSDGTGGTVKVSGDLGIVARPFDSASWSPDGTRMVFGSHDDGAERLYVANADGSGVTAISDRTARRGTPSWSPDGQWIAYRMEASDGTHEDLAIARPDGTGERVLVSSAESSAAFSGSRWSPDGTRLAYFRKDHGINRIGVVDLAGRETIVSSSFGAAYSPVWSPDGRSIAFLTDVDGVVVIAADGTNPRVLGRIADCGIDFAPDGTTLLGYTPGACTGLVTVPLTGAGEATAVTLSGEVVGTPSWQRLAP